MKILTLLLLLITFPLLAQDFSETEIKEISLGLVVGAQGDSLILVDGLKVHVPNLSFAQYINEDGNMLSTTISYPFTATLIVSGSGSETSEISPRTATSVIKIHAFYTIVEGRLVEQNYD